MTLLVILYTIVVAWLIFQLTFPFLTVLASRLFGLPAEARSAQEGREKPYNPPSRFALRRVNHTAMQPFDFACIITAYKNSAIAKPLVESLLQQTHDHYTIYLVADECPDFDFGISDPRFLLIRPESPLRLKVKSIAYAVEHFARPHDFIAVFDADNLAHPAFLEAINQYANAGFRCIQGQRTAKNLDSNYAAADSLGELYKNYIERYAPFLLGGSAVISGSGMATQAELYRAYLASPEIAQGQHHGKKMLQEDKILQNFLLRRNERIAYARKAICYDEKVETGEAVATQRGRWLFSYFQNIPNALGILRRGLFGGSANQFFFGIVTLALPMFIQLAVAFLFVLIGLWLAPWIAVALMAAIGIFALNVLWVLRLSNAPNAVWNAVGALPRFVSRQAQGLLKMGNPDKNFKHSEHKKMVSVDDILKKQ